MAIPVFSPNYGSDIKAIRAQQDTAAKQRAADKDAQLRKFGMDVGLGLLKSGLDLGADAFKNYLTEPLEETKAGVVTAPTRDAAIKRLQQSLSPDQFETIPQSPLPGARAKAPGVKPPSVTTALQEVQAATPTKPVSPITYEMDAKERAAAVRAQAVKALQDSVPELDIEPNDPKFFPAYVPPKSMPKPPVDEPNVDPIEEPSFEKGNLPTDAEPDVDPLAEPQEGEPADTRQPQRGGLEPAVPELGSDPAKRLDQGQPSTVPTIPKETPPPVQYQERQPEDFKPGKVELIIKGKGQKRTIAPGPSEPSPPQPDDIAGQITQGLTPRRDEEVVDRRVSRRDATSGLDESFMQIAKQRSTGAVAPQGRGETFTSPPFADKPGTTYPVFDPQGNPTGKVYDLSGLSERELGRFYAAQQVLATARSDAAYKDALSSGAKSKSAEPMNDLQKAQLAKLERTAEAAKRTTQEGTPEYEDARLAYNDKVMQLAQRTQVGISGSGSKTLGGDGKGGVSGSSSYNLPRSMVIAVEDEHGWMTTVTIGGQRDVPVKNRKGKVIRTDKVPVFYGRPYLQDPATGEWTRTQRIEYRPEYDERTKGWTAYPVDQGSEAPKPGIVAPPTGRPPAPRGNPPGRGTPGGTPVGKPAPVSDTPPAAGSQAPAADAFDENTADPEDIRARAKVLDAAAQKYTPGDSASSAKARAAAVERDRLLAVAKKADADIEKSRTPEAVNRATRAKTELTQLDTNFATKLETLYGPVDREYAGLKDNRDRIDFGGDKKLSMAQFNAAKKGLPYVAQDSYEKDRPTAAAARQAAFTEVSNRYAGIRSKAVADYAPVRKAALAEAITAEVALRPRQVVSIKKFLEGQGLLDQFTEDERKAIFRELSPSYPNLQTKAQDLFDRVNAQPWSAAKKRKVYLATAQRDGIA